MFRGEFTRASTSCAHWVRIVSGGQTDVFIVDLGNANNTKTAILSHVAKTTFLNIDSSVGRCYWMPFNLHLKPHIVAVVQRWCQELLYRVRISGI